MDPAPTPKKDQFVSYIFPFLTLCIFAAVLALCVLGLLELRDMTSKLSTQLSELMQLLKAVQTLASRRCVQEAPAL